MQATDQDMARKEAELIRLDKLAFLTGCTRCGARRGHETAMCYMQMCPEFDSPDLQMIRRLNERRDGKIIEWLQQNQLSACPQCLTLPRSYECYYMICGVDVDQALRYVVNANRHRPTETNGLKNKYRRPTKEEKFKTEDVTDAHYMHYCQGTNAPASWTDKSEAFMTIAARDMNLIGQKRYIAQYLISRYYEKLSYEDQKTIANELKSDACIRCGLATKSDKCMRRRCNKCVVRTPNVELNLLTIVNHIKQGKFKAKIPPYKSCLCGANQFTEDCLKSKCSLEHIQVCWRDRSPGFMKLIERDIDFMQESVYDDKVLLEEYFSKLSEKDQETIKSEPVGCKKCSKQNKTKQCLNYRCHVLLRSNVIINYQQLIKSLKGWNAKQVNFDRALIAKRKELYQAKVKRTAKDEALWTDKSPEFLALLQRDYEFLCAHRYRGDKIVSHYFDKLSGIDQQTIVREHVNFGCYRCGAKERSFACMGGNCNEPNSNIHCNIIDLIKKMQPSKNFYSVAYHIRKNLTIKCMCGIAPKQEECVSAKCSIEHIRACLRDKSPEFIEIIERDLPILQEARLLDNQIESAYMDQLNDEDIAVISKEAATFRCLKCGSTSQSEECVRMKQRTLKLAGDTPACEPPFSNVIFNILVVMRHIQKMAAKALKQDVAIKSKSEPLKIKRKRKKAKTEKTPVCNVTRQRVEIEPVVFDRLSDLENLGIKDWKIELEITRAHKLVQAKEKVTEESFLGVWQDKSDAFNNLMLRDMAIMNSRRLYGYQLERGYFDKLSATDKAIILEEIPNFNCTYCGATEKSELCARKKCVGKLSCQQMNYFHLIKQLVLLQAQRQQATCLCNSDPLTEDCLNPKCSFEHIMICWHQKPADFMAIVFREMPRLEQLSKEQLTWDFLSPDDMQKIRIAKSFFACKVCSRSPKTYECQARKCKPPVSTVMQHWLSLINQVEAEAPAIDLWTDKSPEFLEIIGRDTETLSTENWKLSYRENTSAFFEKLTTDEKQVLLAEIGRFNCSLCGATFRTVGCETNICFRGLSQIKKNVLHMIRVIKKRLDKQQYAIDVIGDTFGIKRIKRWRIKDWTIERIAEYWPGKTSEFMNIIQRDLEFLGKQKYESVFLAKEYFHKLTPADQLTFKREIIKFACERCGARELTEGCQPHTIDPKKAAKGVCKEPFSRVMRNILKLIRHLKSLSRKKPACKRCGLRKGTQQCFLELCEFDKSVHEYAQIVQGKWVKYECTCRANPYTEECLKPQCSFEHIRICWPKMSSQFMAILERDKAFLEQSVLAQGEMMKYYYNLPLEDRQVLSSEVNNFQCRRCGKQGSLIEISRFCQRYECTKPVSNLIRNYITLAVQIAIKMAKKRNFLDRYLEKVETFEDRTKALAWTDKSPEFMEICNRDFLFLDSRRFKRSIIPTYFDKLNERDKLVIMNELPRFKCKYCGVAEITSDCLHLKCMRDICKAASNILRLVRKLKEDKQNARVRITLPKDLSGLSCMCNASPVTEECLNPMCSFEHIFACWPEKTPEFLSIVERDMETLQPKLLGGEILLSYLRQLSEADQKILTFELSSSCRQCGAAVISPLCMENTCTKPRSHVLLNLLNILPWLQRHWANSSRTNKSCARCKTKNKTEACWIKQCEIVRSKNTRIRVPKKLLSLERDILNDDDFEEIIRDVEDNAEVIRL